MKLAVILLNLGGPATLSEVRPFLYNLFSDPDIIPVPFARWLQKPIAHLISIIRRPMSSKYYRAIGGGSPLKKITLQQAEALEKQLKSIYDEVSVYVAMRYWHPFSSETWRQVTRDQRTHVVVLPLYPQYSVATTGSSVKVLEQIMVIAIPFIITIQKNGNIFVLRGLV